MRARPRGTARSRPPRPAPQRRKAPGPDGAVALGRALDSLGDTFVLVDGHGRVLAANAHAAELCGRPGASLDGADLAEVLPVAGGTAVRTAVERAALGEPQNFDVRPSNGGAWYAGHAYPVPGGVLVHLHNITARRHIEDSLTFLADAGAALTSVVEEDQLLRAVAELVVPRLGEWCVVALRDPASGTLRFDVSAAQGVVRDRLLAAVDGGAPGEAETASLVERAMAARAPEVLTRAGKGRRAARRGVWSFTAAALAAPLIGRQGGAGVILAGRGAAAAPFRRDELGLAAALGHRAGLVLDNVRLLAAARRATRLRDDVLTIVAHDLRGPLNAIVLGATALPGGAIPEYEDLQQTAKRSVLAAANQMNRLLDDLVNAARLDAGWAPRERRRVKASRLLEDAAQTFRWRAEKGGVRLEVRAEAAGDETVEVDAGRMYEAVGNLLDNAFKFTPRGGTVTLSAERLPQGVRLSVADTGRGMDAETLEHLFDRFWQARRSARAGAGLGLFIARRIVEGHGGRIRAESAPGRGSVFHITLPRAAAAGGGAPAP